MSISRQKSSLVMQSFCFVSLMLSWQSSYPPKLRPHFHRCDLATGSSFLAPLYFLDLAELSLLLLSTDLRMFSCATLSTSTVPLLRQSFQPKALRACNPTARRFLIERTRLPCVPRAQQYATAAAQQTHTVHPEPPPPRNAGVPDTSIAGGDPRVDSSPRPFSQTSPSRLDLRQKQTQPDPPNASVPESEAQIPRKTSGEAVGGLASDISSTQATQQPLRKSKLRPRKAAMMLTPRAVEQLESLLSQPTPKLIRVGVKNRGCSGLAYSLEYVEKPGTFDEKVEQDGVKVLIDSKALFSIIGSEMDWVEDKLSARFVFRNPNISQFQFFFFFSPEWK